MKKYLLTALLGVFGLFGAFTSANTVGNFSSSSEICTFASSESFRGFSLYDIYNASDSPCFIENDEGPTTFYICISTEDFPYTMQSWGYVSTDEITVNSANHCFPGAFSSNGDSNLTLDKTIIGSAYVSASLITYTPPSSGGGSGDGGMIEGGISALSPILSGLTNIVSELIPYVVYIGLGIVVATIGFIAIRWLMNRTQAKVRGTFSSGRRRK